MKPTKNIQPKFSSLVRGIFSPSIPYEMRNENGDWSPYFGTYEGQKHQDLDTNCCWAFAGNEVFEDSLEFLWKTNQISILDMQWLQQNGYIDSDGDFYLSRRFIPIISGVQRNGNDQAEFWRLSGIYGAIPNSVLPYTNNQEYFDKTKITPAMYALGAEFKSRFNIPFKEVGNRFYAKDIGLLKDALFQSELQIGIPVPPYSNWNQTKIKWGGNKSADHSVALYKIDEVADPQYPYFIYDQYEPHLKQLSSDFFIPMVTQAVVSPVITIIGNPVSQTTLWAKIWTAIAQFFNSYPGWVHA